MAILRVGMRLCSQFPIIQIIEDNFDFVQEIDRDYENGIITFRVNNEFVCAGDHQVEVDIYFQTGIKPFIIGYNEYM